MKKVIRQVLVFFIKPLSFRRRMGFLQKIIHLFISEYSPKERLQFLFEMDRHLYGLQGQASATYGKGIHSKHRHTNYHEYFVKNISTGDRVLDIGSGNGFMTYDMATKVSGVEVVGIDLDQSNVESSSNHYIQPNLRFVHGDALKDLPDEQFDVVTLSNVLEHIDDRVSFLRETIRKLKPRKFIIRVPSFERDWRVPLKKELGIDYRLDETHFTEYTLEQFSDETQRAGLEIQKIESRWGEIWSVLHVRNQDVAP
ncbi:MAG: class I SAM-dependent methyltransferase [Candidatus Omnitrophica bacterium]|nr:class I SAM-dependent methyltransferase [Candidatus Omnitrophota bacterium]